MACVRSDNGEAPNTLQKDVGEYHPKVLAMEQITQQIHSDGTWIELEIKGPSKLKQLLLILMLEYVCKCCFQ